MPRKLLLAGITCLAVCVWAWARDLGPEWTLIDGQYVRNLEVKAKRYADGNVTNNTVKMEKNEVSLSETDDDRGFGLRCHPYGAYEVRKAKDGTLASVRVSFGNDIFYEDMNGDGFFDTMTDARELIGSKSFIFFEGRFVQVGAGKGGVGETARSQDWQTVYVFKDGSWLVDDKKTQTQRTIEAASRRNFPLEKIETQWVSHGSHRGFGGWDWPEPEGDELLALTLHWAKSISPPELTRNPELTPYLNLIRPQPESAFIPFQQERLSSELMIDSIGWMDIFFQPEVNPYTNQVNVVVPDRRRIGEQGPRRPSIPLAVLENEFSGREPGTRDYDEWRGRMDQAKAAAPLSSRARPTKYYLAPADGLSLLWYEYDAAEFQFQIIESSAALLVRLKPHGPFDLRQGIPQQQVAKMLAAVLNPPGFTPEFASRLPAVLKTGQVFSTSADDSYAAFLKHKFQPPDWARNIVGFASDKHLCLVLRKSEIVEGTPTPYHSHWGEPHPDWLRQDLYESNGTSLVIDRGKSQQAAALGLRRTTNAR